jgi:iron complex outermembrane recepter protein
VTKPPFLRPRWRVGSAKNLVSGTLAWAAMLVCAATSAWAQQKTADLSNESLEDLMNIQVLSVSKTEQSLSHTAAAIFVITQEDIRRSGATNIPDLLRMVPGMDVAQINANTWAVAARGFNARFANELFVMVDGRSVYTPTTGGVFWDVLDLPLEDIERIEVIRGPGGSIWGVNAVNGVINIITKKASETKGGLVTAGGGNIDQGFGTVQYGGAAGKSTDYRVFTKYLNEDHFPSLSGTDGGDGWHMLRGGFRTDTSLSPDDGLVFEGDLYSAREGYPSYEVASIPAPGLVPTDLLVNLSGGYLQGIWKHTFSTRSEATVEGSYDKYERDDELGEARKTFDINLQDHFLWKDRHSFTAGFEYRDSDSRTNGNLFVAIVPSHIRANWFSEFAQDEIALAPDRLYLTLGAKLEHNDYTGFNLMPSARIAWTPTTRQTLWAAVSDAVRSPADIDVGLRAFAGSFIGPGGTPVVLRLYGNPNLDDEGLIAYEMGYRTTIAKRLSVDFASYYGDYQNQITDEPGTPIVENSPPPVYIVVPLVEENLMHGETNGIEVAVNWKVTDRWTLNPGYAFEEIHMRLDPTSHDTTSVSEAEGSSPDNQSQLRSRVELSHGLTWDSSAYFVGRLTDPSMPSYTRLDTQLSWKFSERGSLSLVGQNLVKNLHEEFVDSTNSVRNTLVKRGAYAKFTLSF